MLLWYLMAVAVEVLTERGIGRCDTCILMLFASQIYRFGTGLLVSGNIP